MKKKDLFVSVLSVLFIVGMIKATKDGYFDPKGSKAEIKAASDVLSEIAPLPGDKVSGNMIVYNHRGSVGVGREFTTARLFDEVKSEYKSKYKITNPNELKLEAKSLEFCRGIFKITISAVVTGAYSITVIKDNTAPIPLGCH